MKKVHFTAMKVLFFLKHIDIDKLLVCGKISSGEKNYKYFIDYLYNDQKIKTLQAMLPKTSANVKIYEL